MRKKKGMKVALSLVLLALAFMQRSGNQARGNSNGPKLQMAETDIVNPVEGGSTMKADPSAPQGNSPRTTGSGEAAPEPRGQTVPAPNILPEVGHPASTELPDTTEPPDNKNPGTGEGAGVEIPEVNTDFVSPRGENETEEDFF